MYYRTAAKGWTRTQQAPAGGLCYDVCNANGNGHGNYPARGGSWCGTWLDADRDGKLDFIAGAMQAFAQEKFDVGPQLILGSDTSAGDQANLPTRIKLQPVYMGERFTFLNGADVNGDGADDLVIGGPRACVRRCCVC